MAQNEPLRVQIEPSPELLALIDDLSKAAREMREAAREVFKAASGTNAAARSKR